MWATCRQWILSVAEHAQYWACMRVTMCLVLVCDLKRELVCAHLWISMQLAKNVNCVWIVLRQILHPCGLTLHHTHTHAHLSNLSDSSCSLTLSDCTFEYVTEERQKAEVTPRDHILVQDPYLKNMTTLLESVLMNYSISLNSFISHPRKK